MKSIQKFLLFCFSLFVITSASYADGDYFPGEVTLLDNNTFMYGYFNVRYNPNVTTGAVRYVVNPGMSFTISGTDSTTGANFSCFHFAFYNPTQHAKWEDALLRARNGAMIAVKSAPNTLCQDFFVILSSKILD
jgi:hypothetical protein